MGFIIIGMAFLVAALRLSIHGAGLLYIIIAHNNYIPIVLSSIQKLTVR